MKNGDLVFSFWQLLMMIILSLFHGVK